MERSKYQEHDSELLLEDIESKIAETQAPTIFVFDFDGVLSASKENQIYRLSEDANEAAELRDMATAWEMNLSGYDVPYQRHLLFQAAAAQLKCSIEPGMACPIAQKISKKGYKIYVLSSRSGIYAIRRMHDFLNDNEIAPTEIFHVGRVTKDRQLALLLEKFQTYNIFYLEDEARHLNDIEKALHNHPQEAHLHLIEIDTSAGHNSTAFLATFARAVIRRGFEGKLGGGSMKEDELRKIGLEHGRQLFIYHAGQRVQSIGQYFAALAFLTAGTTSILTSSTMFPHKREVGIVFSFVGLLITGILFGIDRRNAHLVNIDEDLVKEIERNYGSRLFPGTTTEQSCNTGNNPFTTMDNAEKRYKSTNKTSNKKPIFRYHWLVRCVFGLFAGIWLFLIGLFYLMAQGCRSSEPVNKWTSLFY